MVSYLIEQGANVEAKMSSGATPIVIASQKGFTEIVKLLLDEEADVSVYGGEEYNALHLAVMGGFTDVVRMLLQRGMRVDEESKNGQTALWLSVSKQSVPLITLLLRYGANYHHVHRIEKKTVMAIVSPRLAHLFEGLRRVKCKIIPLLLATQQDLTSTEFTFNSVSTLFEVVARAEYIYSKKVTFVFVGETKIMPQDFERYTLDSLSENFVDQNNMNFQMGMKNKESGQWNNYNSNNSEKSKLRRKRKNKVKQTKL